MQQPDLDPIRLRGKQIVAQSFEKLNRYWDTFARSTARALARDPSTRHLDG